jgi:hypothetical protein
MAAIKYAGTGKFPVRDHNSEFEKICVFINNLELKSIADSHDN